MKTATAALTARHSHLLRAAQSAGEVFAHAGAEESGAGRERSPVLAALWIGAGALAALSLYLTF
jgi:hypothetical protein